MQTFSFTGAGRQIDARFNFVRYEVETGGAVNQGVRVRAEGTDLGIWLPGDFCELPGPISQLTLAPVTTAAGEFRVGMGKFGSQRTSISGAIQATVVNARQPFSNLAATVTTTSAQLIAANGARQYLLIQNKSSVGNIWLSHSAGPATQANGLRIAPGGYWEWDSTIPTGAVFAVGDVASNPDILIIEG